MLSPNGCTEQRPTRQPNITLLGPGVDAMANLRQGVVLSGDTFTHLEVETNRTDVQSFINDLQNELANNPNAQAFRLQIMKRAAPPSGGGAPITAGDPVTVTLHQHQ